MKIVYLDFFIIHTTIIDLEITPVLSHYYVTFLLILMRLLNVNEESAMRLLRKFFIH
jgi:hypothetical protein